MLIIPAIKLEVSYKNQPALDRETLSHRKRRQIGSLTNSKWRRTQFPLCPVLSSSLVEDMGIEIK